MISFCAGIVLLSAASIYARYKNPGIYRYAKGLPVIALILFLSLRLPAGSASYAWIIAGLGFGLIGDLFLLSEKMFLPGLAAFLTGHLCYIGAFGLLSDRLPLWLILSVAAATSAYGFLIVRNLLSSGKKTFAIPVVLYSVVIGVMILAAYSWQTGQDTEAFPFIFFGSLLFAVSDSILGWETFVHSFPEAQFMILLTYYAAQCLIAVGAYAYML